MKHATQKPAPRKTHAQALERWNGRYSAPGFLFGDAPNTYLASKAGLLPQAGRALSVADGEGRNSVWLAAQGHQVLAVDLAEVGLAKARQLALAQGAEVSARLRTQRVDLSEWAPPVGQFDAVVLTYVHLPSSFRAEAHRRLATALRRGGLLILEAFHPSQLGRSSGAPRTWTCCTRWPSCGPTLAAFCKSCRGAKPRWC